MTTANDPLGFDIHPEQIGPFGSFAPSLLVPFLTWRNITQELIGSTGSVATIPGNVNRWGFCLASSLATYCYLQRIDPAIGLAPTIWCAAEQTKIVTFADIGSLISEPFWSIVAPPGGCSCHEIIYRPRRCN